MPKDANGFEILNLQDYVKETFPDGPPEAFQRLMQRPDVNGFIKFENQMMDSSLCGESTTMAYGPGCTYKDPKEVVGRPLGTLPSNFQYPVAVIPK